ncbi:L,D-transpeptidase family protein [uncultured Sphingomonas sp.]|nr:L,D-transpeptidase family protein [uncultured Sphingomonas sp.]
MAIRSTLLMTLALLATDSATGGESDPRIGTMPATLYAAAEALRPGQYMWRDDDLSLGEISVVINRSAQVAMVYRGQTLVAVSSVSTGKPGKRTPLGDFTILQKKVWHRSNLYSNAPMPYMQRLTWDGIALHAGVNPGYPASHGCIRLPSGFAQLLYGVTKMGASVAVIDDESTAPVPKERFPLIIADVGGLDGAAFGRVTWRTDVVPPVELRGSTGLAVLGDEWMVPDSPLMVPTG